MNNSSLPDVDQGSCWLFSSTFFTTLLVVVSLAAFVGNILVVIVVFKTPILRTSTNFYYVNMAVSDFLGALFTWPVYLTHEIITSKGSLLHGTLASAGCKTGAYIRLLSYLVSKHGINRGGEVHRDSTSLKSDPTNTKKKSSLNICSMVDTDNVFRASHLLFWGRRGWSDSLL